MKKNKRSTFIRNWLAIFLGAIGSQTIYVFMYNYSMVFFTDFLGISAGVAGTIFVLSRVWDAVNDPMCGTLIDKTDSRFGKTQPFMFFGGIFTSISLVMLFTVPGLSLTGKTIWAAVSYNIVGMAFTAVVVSILAQMPRASKNPKERVHFSVAYSVGCSITGIAAAALITRGLALFTGSTLAKGYQTVAIVLAVIGFVFIIGNVVLFKEQDVEEKKQENQTDIRTMILAVLHTRQFLIMVLAIFIVFIGQGISAGSLIYYVNYKLKAPELIQILLPLTYIALLGSSSVSGWFTRFGKIRMMRISMVMIFVGYAGRILTGDSNIVITAVLYSISCAGNGFLSTFLIPCLMDCADYTEYKMGVKCEALTLTGFTLCSKMASGIGTAILGFGLQIAGYDGMAAVQNGGTVHMISVAHLYSISVLSLIGLLILAFYKLDEEKMTEVRKLMQRKVENTK